MRELKLDSLTSEITPFSSYLKRRELLLLSGLSLLSGTSFGDASSTCTDLMTLPQQKNITLEKHAKHYNNYYEFSTDKKAVAYLAKELTLSPWDIRFTGLLEKEFTIPIENLLKLCKVQRTYRFRCVEGWSMVIPWEGVLLKDIIKLARPLSSAKYVAFISLHRPKEMIGQRSSTLAWPYTEALRMDEALQPLTLMATGFYGKELSPQNGAPLRLVVPWKYGYKSAKAITEIKFMESMPVTTWMQAAPKEYGFYANVNPNIPHPRWSQRRETPLGNSKKVPTLMYNGYEKYVASLYKNIPSNVL